MAKSSSKKPLFTSPKSRAFASTLGVLLTGLIVTAGMPLYLPFGQADNLALPVIGFPIIWFCLFLIVLFIEKIWKVWLLLFVLSVVHATIIYLALAG